MYEFHEIANIFPLIEGREFEELKADIAANGLLEPIWLYEGKILDGRNRYRACVDVGTTPMFQEYKGRDALAFVLSLNLMRRHLSATQLAFVALKIEKYESERAKERQGARSDIEVLIPQSEMGRAAEKAADAVGVSAKYVKDAKRLEQEAPALAAECKTGKKTITQAMREVKEAAREQRRDENRALIAKAPSPTQAQARYATIVIDPPWDWGDEGDADQLGRARPTYGTMSFEQLLGLPVEAQADIDCHLYLWITNRSLPKGFALMEKWGFRYITALTWCKPSFGMGNYFRGSTEHVLFGVRGSQQLKRKDVGTWFSAPRGPKGHSSKPVEFYSLVESCSPGPYLEMFARSDREGWVSWGAEVDAA